MSENQDALVSKGAVAKAVVDRLVAIASGLESDEWLEKHVAIQQALACGRFHEAVRAEWRLVDYRIQPEWVVSRELAEILKSAIGNLARELGLPNSGEAQIFLDELPTDVTELGTIAEENKRRMRDYVESIRRHPLDDDPRYAEVLKAASEQAMAELADHPLKGDSFFFWVKKKEILRKKYGLEWLTPMELNPDMMIFTS